MGKLKNILGGAISRLRRMFSSESNPPVQESSESSPEAPIEKEKSAIIPTKEQVGTKDSVGEASNSPKSIPDADSPLDGLDKVEDTEKSKDVEQTASSSTHNAIRNRNLKQYTTPSRRWEFHGKSLTLDEWAKEYGVSKTTMWERLNKHNSPEKPPQVRTEIEFNGESHTISEWAAKYGVTDATMRYRIAKWHQPELPKECAQATFTTPPLVEDTSNISIVEKEGTRVIIKDGVEYTIWQFAKEIGIKFSTLRGRVKKSLDARKVFSGLRYIGGREGRKCAVQGKIWEFNGEKHTVAEWSKICGTSKAMMRLRLMASGNPWKNDIKKTAYNERRTKKYIWEGQEFSIKQLCERFSCSDSAMRVRMRKYGTPEKPKTSAEAKKSEEPKNNYEVIEETAAAVVQYEIQMGGDNIPNDEREGFNETSEELLDGLSAEERELIRHIKLEFPIDMSKYSAKKHSATFNSFIREIRRIINSPDDGMPLSRIIGYGDID